MPDSEQPNNHADIPETIFKKLIEELSGSDIPPEIIARLNKTVIADKNFSETAIKTAIFPNPS